MSRIGITVKELKKRQDEVIHLITDRLVYDSTNDRDFGMFETRICANRIIWTVDPYVRREVCDELLHELREYRDKYPDADYMDCVGFIAGYKARFKEVASTNTTEEK